MFALEFPPIDNLVKWPNYFGDDTFYAFNKIGLISLLAMAIPTVMFLLSKKELVPSGLQNIVESTVGFVEDQVVMSAIGAEGRKYLPLLLSIFLFVFFGNIFEVIPTFQMPANARMANPALLAAMVAAGLPSDRFLFAGFLPPKQAARRAALQDLAGVPSTLIFYESPKRAAATCATF